MKKQATTKEEKKEDQPKDKKQSVNESKVSAKSEFEKISAPAIVEHIVPYDNDVVN